MARFIDTENDDSIVDFNNMTFRQFRYLVGQAIKQNNFEKEKYFYENYDEDEF